MVIISAEELAAQIGRSDLVVVDCRWALGNPSHGLDAYGDGHLPGAVFADLETDLSSDSGPGRHPLPNPETFDRFLGSIGATPNSTIVAYDDASGAIAARLWWMLTDQGHNDTFILDGGIKAWTDAGHELSKDAPLRDEPEPAGIAVHPWRAVASIDEVATRDPGTIVVDARAAARFRGDHEPVDARPGHIPGAINLPHGDNIRNGLFAEPGELRTRFEHAGIGVDSDVIVHCGSGVTACHDIAAWQRAGLPRPRLYVGSWSEWAASDLPAETSSAT